MSSSRLWGWIFPPRFLGTTGAWSPIWSHNEYSSYAFCGRSGGLLKEESWLRVVWPLANNHLLVHFFTWKLLKIRTKCTRTKMFKCKIFLYKNVYKQMFSRVVSEKEYRAIFPALILERTKGNRAEVGSWRCVEVLCPHHPSSPWSIAWWITKRWLHLWGKSTQSGQLLPIGDKQSSTGATPDESFWDVITRVGNGWNYPVQHQAQSGCKSAEAVAEEECSFFMICQQSSTRGGGCVAHLNNIIKWLCKEI